MLLLLPGLMMLKANLNGPGTQELQRPPSDPAAQWAAPCVDPPSSPVRTALGLGLAGLAIKVLNVPFIFQPGIIIVAFLFSALIGTIFGYFPARRAARLNPIDALRHE